MPEQYRVKLLLADDSKVDGVFALSEEFDPANVSLIFEGRVIESKSVRDYFDGFCEIRKMLERDGIYPLCFGSRVDVYPSGMSRSMGGGVKGYRLSLGSQVGVSDLVNIFDSSEEVVPSKVSAQEEYFKKWIQSLGK
ncbi:MAG: hypothetical protein AAGB46_04890 [Verrucomicrobiota bacterium]